MSKSPSSYVSPPKDLAPKDHLNLLDGILGLTKFLKILSNLLLAFHQAGPEFLLSVKFAPHQPHEEDFYDSSGKISSPGSVSPKRSSTKSDDPPSFVYPHDPTTKALTPRGEAKFDAATDKYTLALDSIDAQRRTLFVWLLSQFTPSTIQTLEGNPAFLAARDSTSVYDLRLVLDKSTALPSVLRSLTTLRKIQASMQPINQPVSTFLSATHLLFEEVTIILGSTDHPGHICIQHLHKLCILAGINDAMYDELRAIINDPKSNFNDLSAAELVDMLAKAELNSNQRAKNAAPRPPPTVPPAPPSVPTEQSLALGTVHRVASCWTPTNPHHRPKYDSTKPFYEKDGVTIARNGDPKLPHCPHCAKNGWVSHTHGFSGKPPCIDLQRLNDLTSASDANTAMATFAAQQSLLIDALNGALLDVPTPASNASITWGDTDWSPPSTTFN